MPINELVYLFRTIQESRPIFLLGAGASFRSGIPTAAEAVKRIAKAAYAKNVKGMDWRVCQVPLSDWTSYLHNQPWFLSDEARLAENFPLAVENLLLPKEFRRRFFEDMISPPNGINEGYQHLAELIQRGLCWTVLTGNFDHLIVEAITSLSEKDRAFRVDPNGDRGGDQNWRCTEQGEAGKDEIEAALGDRVPVGDRLVEDIEEARRANE